MHSEYMLLWILWIHWPHLKLSSSHGHLNVTSWASVACLLTLQFDMSENYANLCTYWLAVRWCLVVFASSNLISMPNINYGSQIPKRFAHFFIPQVILGLFSAMFEIWHLISVWNKLVIGYNIPSRNFFLFYMYSDSQILAISVCVLMMWVIWQLWPVKLSCNNTTWHFLKYCNACNKHLANCVKCQ